MTSVVFDAVEASLVVVVVGGGFLEHAEAQPGEDLTDVFHHGGGLDAEFPVEVAGLGVFELDGLAEGDEGVGEETGGVGAGGPEVGEEVVPFGG